MAITTSTDKQKQTILFDSREHYKSLGIELLRRAKKQICFFGKNIDSTLFDDPEVLAYLSEFARRSDKTQILFAIHSSQQNISSGHRLLPLAQKLTSSIKINAVSRKHQELTQMFLIIDDDCYLSCQSDNRYQGKVGLNVPADVRPFQQKFDTIWEHSTPDISLRRLNI